jgi:hypothetical protein
VTRTDWIFRPVLWFVTASTINVVLHEGAHAVTAFALGLQPTLYQFWVYWDTDTATLAQQALARAAGPAFSLVVGFCCWLAYRAKKQSAAGLPLLYLSTGGIAMFFGHLMSSPWAGDFFAMAGWLELPMTARYTVSAIGAVGTAAVMIWLGRQLREWIPAEAGKAMGVVGVVVAPIVLGTALVVLINEPLPNCPQFLPGKISEALFGIFTLLGAARPGTPAAGRSFQLRWSDGGIALATVLIVRVMAFGITF